MNLRHIEIFHAVYVNGSVSAAARALNVSQPSVSKTLRHAESLLGFVGGVFLFHEHPLLDPAETIRVRADIQADILAEFAGQFLFEQQLERADRRADILRGQGVDARFLEDLDGGPGRGGEQHDAAQQQAQQQAPDSK